MNIDELIIRTLQGRATSEEIEQLQARLSDNADNQQHYRDVVAVWNLSNAASDVVVTSPPSAAAVLAHLEDVSRASPAAPLGGWTRARRMSRLLGAGLAAACLAIGLGLSTLLQWQEEQNAVLLHGEIATNAGELTTVTLADGSSIRLGPKSKLRLLTEGHTRVAELDGRAFFGVRSDGSRFLVRTRLGDVEVLGTRFEVRTEDEEFRVLVVDGRVSVQAGGTEAHLGEGEITRSLGGAPPISMHVDDVYAHLDWMGTTLVFQATPLRSAVRELEYRYGVPIILTDSVLAETTVTATFADEPLERVLMVLCEAVSAHCTVTSNLARITRPGGEN